MRRIVSALQQAACYKGKKVRNNADRRGIVVERERSRRVAASEVAVLTILPERVIRVVCRIANFSKMGLGLNSDTPVPARSEVLIEMDGCIVSGEVCYCREIGHDYRIGIQLDQMLAVPSEEPAEPVRHIYKAGTN